MGPQGPEYPEEYLAGIQTARIYRGRWAKRWGKSTLVDAIAGYRPATQGIVLVNGTNIYSNFDAVHDDIGYVPQRDIIHYGLTVYQALDYAARLSMPRDTNKDERHKRIMEV